MNTPVRSWVFWGEHRAHAIQFLPYLLLPRFFPKLGALHRTIQQP